ncbi:MAG TPA: hypothetical protein VF815_17990 [Myxococcaceae bacterium]|jgi:hypothetical protein
MPRSTVKYAFEHGLLGWAQNFRAGAGFLVLFGLEGELLEVHEADTGQSGTRLVSHERKAQVTKAHPSWLYFDPFDWPEYAWLEWHRVPRSTLEQMIDQPSLQALRSVKGDLPEIPESWSVMF